MKEIKNERKRLKKTKIVEIAAETANVVIIKYE